MKRAHQQRALRLGDQIQREIASLLTVHVKDPRLQGLTITSVELSADLSLARVRYVAQDMQKRETEINQGLASVTGYLRHALSEVLTIYKVPQLKFEYDRVFDDGARLSRLIELAREEDQRLIKE
jgi:ribosome-binding factor A